MPGEAVPRRLLSSFIDRDEELRLLQQALDLAAQGRGGLIFILGEAGIGKTRLLKEVAEQAHAT